MDVSAAETALEQIAADAGLETPQTAARGIYRVANAKMPRAIREIPVKHGFDPREFGLVAFGGAGPMHAVDIAAEIDIETVIVPIAGESYHRPGYSKLTNDTTGFGRTWCS